MSVNLSQGVKKVNLKIPWGMWWSPYGPPSASKAEEMDLWGDVSASDITLRITS